MLEAANCNFTPIDSPGTGRVGFSDLNAVVCPFYFFVPRDQIKHSSKEKICEFGNAHFPKDPWARGYLSQNLCVPFFQFRVISSIYFATLAAHSHSICSDCNVNKRGSARRIIISCNNAIVRFTEPLAKIVWKSFDDWCHFCLWRRKASVFIVLALLNQTNGLRNFSF